MLCEWKFQETFLVHKKEFSQSWMFNEGVSYFKK